MFQNSNYLLELLTNYKNVADTRADTAMCSGANLRRSEDCVRFVMTFSLAAVTSSLDGSCKNQQMLVSVEKSWHMHRNLYDVQIPLQEIQTGPESFAL